MKIGIMGGTFDPVHLGHLIVAEEARACLELSLVLFIPVGHPWLKAEDRKVSPAASRVDMLRLAIFSNTQFQVSLLEVERAGPTYTADTLALLGQQLGEGTQLFFILGWDSLAELPRWERPGELIRRCQLVAVPRPGVRPPALDALERELPGVTRNIVWLERPLIGISASDIRQRVAQGRSIRYLVPEPVEEYILKHGLYRF